MKPRVAQFIGLAALSLLGCRGDALTGINVVVRFPATETLTQLRIDVTPPTGPAISSDTAAANAALQPDQRVLLLVPRKWIGQRVIVGIAGFKTDKEVLRGEGTAQIIGENIVDVVVELKPSCPSPCAAGRSECLGDSVRQCLRDGDGCLRWTPPQSCPVDRPFCSSGTCAATCTDECKTGERECFGSGYRHCGQSDRDPCLDWEAVIACGSGQGCDSKIARCVPFCGGSPCACTSGQTDACADVGACSGGIRNCAAGDTWGPCVWSNGPTPETCDGIDNDCDGQIDNGLVAPACSKQEGVCQGALKVCAGTAGWLDCDAASYGKQAQKANATYEVDEQACDGRDNDCDGQTDEAAVCCQPSCAGKSCGADNGCGAPCLTGDCGPDGRCQTGKCICSYASCGSVCCAEGERCEAGNCKRVCAVGPVSIRAGDVSGGVALVLDNQDRAHIAYVQIQKPTIQYATNQTGSWTHGDDIASGEGYPALALDKNGALHVSYLARPGQYAYATNASGSWVSQDYGGTRGGLKSSLAVGSDGVIHFAYRALTADGSSRLVYATNTAGKWLPYPTSTSGKPDAGFEAMLVLDSKGNPHICYRSAGPALWYLRIAAGWYYWKLDDQDDAGFHCSIAIDAQDRAHVVYQAAKTNELRYVTVNTPAQNVAKGIPAGLNISFALDAGGKAHVSHLHAQTRKLFYSTNVSGAWVHSVIDNSTVGDTALAIDSGGRAHIAYQRVVSRELVYFGGCR